MDEITLKNLPVQLGKAYQLRDAKLGDEAFAISKACLELFPNKAEVQCLYGILQLDNKQFFEAERAFNTAISIMPEKADFYYFLGELLREQRRYNEAENAYLQCLKYDKKHIYANFHLANLYDVEGRLLEAARYYKKVIEWAPKFQRAFYHLAVIYHKQNKIDDAIAIYQQALELDPNHIGTLSNLGAAFTRDRQFIEAIPYYKRALEVAPEYVAAITNLGGTYIEMDDLKNGQIYMRKALALDPNLPANWRNLTLCTQFDPSDTTDLNTIKSLMENPKLTDEDKIHYHFAIGKIYNDYKEYDKAFAAYKTANDLQGQKMPFVSEAFSSHVRRIMGVYDTVQLKPIDFPSTPNNVEPIIIMGTARSGKTLLEELLLQCPQIGGVGELGIADLANKLPLDSRPRTNYPNWLKTLTPEQAMGIRESYLKKLTRHNEPEFKYIIDTMPGNFMYLGFFAYLFPNVKIIHCKRDPLDACLLMYFKYFIDGHGYSYAFDRLGRYYNQYLAMMAYWRKNLSNNIIDVSYEDLVTEPSATLAKVMAFLKCESNTSFDVSKIHANELEHWRHYEKYLGALKSALAEEVNLVATVKEDKAEELKELMGSAYLSYQEGDTTTTELLCSSLLEHDQTHFAALHLLGIVYFQREDYTKALEYLHRAVALDASVLQLQLDLSRVYGAMGNKSESERYYKLAEILQANKLKNKMAVLMPEQRGVLLSAFKDAPPIIDEFETRLLVQGEMDPNQNIDSFMTRSWDQYFTDLSLGSFRTIHTGEKRAWRMRAWHFIYKNISLVDNILNQTKPEIRILDIGCATGYLRRILEGNIDPKDTKKLYYWGLDVRKEVLEEGVKGIENIESGAQGNLMPSAFILQDTKYSLPFKDSFFDYIVNFEMIKYLPIAQGKALMSEMYRVLNPKGLLFLSTSYSSHQPGFVQSIPFEQIEEMLKTNGFEILSRRGSQSQIQRLLPHIKEEHAPLVQELLKVHPPEMVAAMITPLYPATADQITFICKIAQ